MARRRPQICKVDSNHGRIVNELRALTTFRDGKAVPVLTVTSLAKVARGAPDICVGVGGLNVLFELKMPRNKKGEPEALTEAEIEWHETWQGQVAVVTSSREVAKVLMEELAKAHRWVPQPIVTLALL